MMNNTDNQLAKQLRREKIQARNSLSVEERNNLSRKITEKIIHSDIFQKAETIMLYRAVKGEVDLRFLEEYNINLHKRLVYPLCIREGEMIALHPQKEDAWEIGYKGISEPIMGKSEIIPPINIDLIICPCTVFDEACNRMGMGAGFYDRFLPKCTNAQIAAVAFEVQKTLTVPCNNWDICMDTIFTETSIYKHDSLI